MMFKKGDYIVRIADVPEWLTEITKGNTYLVIEDTNKSLGVTVRGDDGRITKPDSRKFELSKNYIINKILSEI